MGEPLVSQIIRDKNRRRFVTVVYLMAFMLILELVVGVLVTRAQTKYTTQPFSLALVATPSPVVPALSTERVASIPPEAHEQQIQPISISEAQKQVPFPIPLPTWLPDELMLKGVYVGTGPSSDGSKAPISVVVSYYSVHSSESSSSVLAGMGLQITFGSASGGYVIPTSKAKETMVNGRSAMYVHGAWDSNSNWDDSVDAGMLLWEKDDFTYVLSFSGLGLTMEDLIRIAESIQ